MNESPLATVKLWPYLNENGDARLQQDPPMQVVVVDEDNQELWDMIQRVAIPTQMKNENLLDGKSRCRAKQERFSFVIMQSPTDPGRRP